MIIAAKVFFCLLGWICIGSAVERSTKLGRLTFWLDVQILASLALIMIGAFLS